MNTPSALRVIMTLSRFSLRAISPLEKVERKARSFAELVLSEANVLRTTGRALGKARSRIITTRVTRAPDDSSGITLALRP